MIGLNSDIDYRIEKLSRMPVYITPLGAEAERLMNEAWEAMTHGHRAAPEVIALKGREIVVPSASGQAARFPFADLCEKPLGARDYLAIASRLHNLVRRQRSRLWPMEGATRPSASSC